MTIDSSGHKHQPEGTPTGGQFARKERTEGEDLQTVPFYVNPLALRETSGSMGDHDRAEDGVLFGHFVEPDADGQPVESELPDGEAGWRAIEYIERRLPSSLRKTIISITDRGVPHLPPTSDDETAWEQRNQFRREQGLFD